MDDVKLTPEEGGDKPIVPTPGHIPITRADGPAADPRLCEIQFVPRDAAPPVPASPPPVDAGAEEGGATAAPPAPPVPVPEATPPPDDAPGDAGSVPAAESHTIPQDTAAAIQQLLDPDHLADLKASDLSDTQILACRFRTIGPEWLPHYLNQSKRWSAARGRGLAIPYYGTDGEPMACLDRETGATITGKDGKPITHIAFKPKNRVAESRKYECRYLARNRAYFPPGSRAKISDPSVCVIFVEGQKKAARGDQDGYVCVGLNGVEGWSAPRPKDANGKKVERKLMSDLAALVWRGRTVFICFDSDIRDKPGVQWAEYALAKGLRKLGAKVKVVRLPDLSDGSKCGLDDFLKAHGKEAFDKLLAAAGRPRRPGSKPRPRPKSRSGLPAGVDGGGAVEVEGAPPAPPAALPKGAREALRPQIVHNACQYDDVDAQALAALIEWNKVPTVFVGNGGFLCQVYQPDPTAPHVVRRLDAASLRLIFGTIITWMRQSGDDVNFDFPPTALLTSFPARGTWPGIPHLRAIISYPAYGKNWERVATQGYHAATGIFCDLNGLEVPPVPDHPMPGDVSEAKRLLLGEVLYDFPFEDDASQVNALAMFILPVIRNALDGPTPLYVVDAPAEGTGKSLLAEAIALATTGGVPEAISPDMPDEEWNKALLAMLMAGKAITYLDNANRKLDSAALASALTAEWKEGRILGESRMARARVNTCWMLTANNFRCSREIGRRCYWTRIDAGIETPSTRTKFKHARLLDWVRDNRPRLLWAILTLVQNWRAQGGKPGSATLGKFEHWAEALSGILEAAGIEGFLSNADEFRQRCPDQVGEVAEFVELWHSKFQGKPVKAQDLFCIAKGVLDGVLTAENDNGQRKQLGKFLAAHSNRVVGKLQIVRDLSDRSRPRYKLIAAQADPPKRSLKALQALETDGDELDLSA